MDNGELNRRWSFAFGLQSWSDKQAYDAICNIPLAPCHRLHQLQMMVEKLCKAFMCVDQAFKEGRPAFLHSHKVIAKVLPNLVKEHCLRKDGTKINSHQLSEIRAISREIELLAPAVDDGKRRPDNSEYPWPAVSGGKDAILTPHEHHFRILDRLRTPTGKLLLRSVFAICEGQVL